MASWDELQLVHPLAERARRGWTQMPVAHLATVRRDGSPRVHPVCPHLAGGRLYVVIGSTSPKRFDLANDGRYALHAIDASEPGPDFDEFEFIVEGRARRVSASEVATWTASAPSARTRFRTRTGCSNWRSRERSPPHGIPSAPPVGVRTG